MPEPALEEMPRIAIWLAPVKDWRVRFRPGVRRMMSSNCRAPRCCSSSSPIALTLTGTSESAWLRLVAVTMISSSSTPVGDCAPACGASATPTAIAT